MVGLHQLVAQVLYFFYSDASFFFVEREAHAASGNTSMDITLQIPLRLVLWQHGVDLWSLSSNINEKWPADAGTQNQDPRLVSPTASH